MKIWFFGPSASGKKTAIRHIYRGHGNADLLELVKGHDAVVPVIIENRVVRLTAEIGRDAAHELLSENRHREFRRIYMSNDDCYVVHGQGIDLSSRILVDLKEEFGDLGIAVYFAIERELYDERTRGVRRAKPYELAYRRQPQQPEKISKFFGSVLIFDGYRLQPC